MPEGISLSEQIYQGLVARAFLIMEPEVKERLIEFWRAEHPEVDEKATIDFNVELTDEWRRRAEMVTAYLVDEVEDQQEWDENSQLWTSIGHHILGFWEWKDENG